MDHKKDQKQEDRYNFDYFDQMNQKEAERKKAASTAPEKPSAQQANGRPSKKQKTKRTAAQPNPSQRTGGQKQQAALAKPQGKGQKPSVKQRKPKASSERQSVGKAPVKADPLPKKRKRQFESPEERQKFMRRRKMLVAMGGTFAVIVVAMVLCLTVFFKVDTIEVIGASRYSAEQIIEASAIQKGQQNLFTLNEGKTEQNVVTSLPYVNTVSISRHLPGKITMEVTDITVVGAVKTSEGYVVIGTNGKMLELLEKKPEHCPVLKGATLTKTVLGEQIEYENPQQKEALDAFAKALQDGEIDNITQIDITDLYSIKATYDGRIQMKFGMPTDMDFKIRFAKAVIDSDKITDQQKGTLDLSLAVDKNRVYFDPDYTVDSDDDKDDKTDKKKTDDDDTSNTSSNDDTTSDDQDNDGDDAADDGDNDNGIPDDYTLDDDGYYYGADGYYDAEGNFTPY